MSGALLARRVPKCNETRRGPRLVIDGEAFMALETCSELVLWLRRDLAREARARDCSTRRTRGRRRAARAGSSVQVQAVDVRSGLAQGIGP